MIINMTPHPIRLVDIDVEIPPSGQVARLAEQRLAYPGETGEIREDMQEPGVWYDEKLLPVEAVQWSTDVDLPGPRPGVDLIVSLALALAAPHDRVDLLVPYDQVRNSEGTVIGYRCLARPCRRA